MTSNGAVIVHSLPRSPLHFRHAAKVLHDDFSKSDVSSLQTPTYDADSLLKENARLRLQLITLRFELERTRLTFYQPSPRRHNETKNSSLRAAAGSKQRMGKRPNLISNESEKEIPGTDIEMHGSARGLHHRRGGTSGSQRTLPPSEMEASLSQTPDDYSDDDLEDGIAPLIIRTGTVDLNADPRASFWHSVQDRAGWLVGLLVLQSMSSFIIARNERLLQQHIVIVQFLTMLVGAGGNAGNQASVRVIRGLAVGTVNDSNVNRFLVEELKMGVTLSAILGVAGCIRAAVFAVPLAETIAITTSLCAIVFISIIVGASLPLLMKRVRIDPAHSSTTIQVLMDILGVTITVFISGTMLDSRSHHWMPGEKRP